MDIIEIIKRDIINLSEEYNHNSLDKYDFWNEHIKYVYEEAIILANKYKADLEIVSLGALLHDIALIKKVGDRKEHHINGKKLANEILTQYNYPKEFMRKTARSTTRISRSCLTFSMHRQAVHKHKENEQRKVCNGFALFFYVIGHIPADG